MLAIPINAPNPEAAHAFINFIMDPQIAADITKHVCYASPNQAAMSLIDPEITSDPAIFPPDDVEKKLWVSTVVPPRVDRHMTRLWTSVKTGR